MPHTHTHRHAHTHSLLPFSFPNKHSALFSLISFFILLFFQTAFVFCLLDSQKSKTTKERKECERERVCVEERERNRCEVMKNQCIEADKMTSGFANMWKETWDVWFVGGEEKKKSRWHRSNFLHFRPSQRGAFCCRSKKNLWILIPGAADTQNQLNDVNITQRWFGLGAALRVDGAKRIVVHSKTSFLYSAVIY